MAQIDDVMYQYVVVALLLLCGLYFSVRLKFVQLRWFPLMIKYINEKMLTKGKNTTSSFQALMITTGSRVGTGNIAGIATAIIMGGPGAVI